MCKHKQTHTNIIIQQPHKSIVLHSNLNLKCVSHAIVEAINDIKRVNKCLCIVYTM